VDRFTKRVLVLVVLTVVVVVTSVVFVVLEKIAQDS